MREPVTISKLPAEATSKQNCSSPQLPPVAKLRSHTLALLCYYHRKKPWESDHNLANSYTKIQTLQIPMHYALSCRVFFLPSHCFIHFVSFSSWFILHAWPHVRGRRIPTITGRAATMRIVRWTAYRVRTRMTSPSWHHPFFQFRVMVWRKTKRDLSSCLGGVGKFAEPHYKQPKENGWKMSQLISSQPAFIFEKGGGVRSTCDKIKAGREKEQQQWQ